MTYGLPYQGSKQKICESIVDALPSAECFVDVFAGGCAVTHAAMLSHKYKRYVCNDITDAPTLFVDAIAGKYKDESRWVSRDLFYMLKDVDPYIRLVWSFGNDQKTYLYGKDIEDGKRLLHKMLFAENVTKRRLAWTELHRYLMQSLQSLEGLERMQSLEGLQSLQRLERLQSLEGLEVHQGDYRELSIPDNSCVYCDPPYKGTKGYTVGFDHDAFWQWCREQTQQVYISEYNAPDDFVCVWSKNRRALMSPKGRNIETERLFVPKRLASVASGKRNLFAHDTD